MTTTIWTSIDSPIGALRVTASDDGLTGVYMEQHRHAPAGVDASWVRDDAAFAETRRQFAAYFDGRLHQFDLPLAPVGTVFQRTVWDALRTIPYGQVRSYGELAEQIGRPTASRAVGMANGRNPLSIIVPCHRVIGSTGALTGYGGGLERKRTLLKLEAAHVGALPAPAGVA